MLNHTEFDLDRLPVAEYLCSKGGDEQRGLNCEDGEKRDRALALTGRGFEGCSRLVSKGSASNAFLKGLFKVLPESSFTKLTDGNFTYFSSIGETRELLRDRLKGSVTIQGFDWMNFTFDPGYEPYVQSVIRKYCPGHQWRTVKAGSSGHTHKKNYGKESKGAIFYHYTPQNLDKKCVLTIPGNKLRNMSFSEQMELRYELLLHCKATKTHLKLIDNTPFVTVGCLEKLFKTAIDHAEWERFIKGFRTGRGYYSFGKGKDRRVRTLDFGKKDAEDRLTIYDEFINQYKTATHYERKVTGKTAESFHEKLDSLYTRNDPVSLILCMRFIVDTILGKIEFIDADGVDFVEGGTFDWWELLINDIDLTLMNEQKRLDSSETNSRLKTHLSS